VQGAGTGGTFDEGVTNNGATSGTLTFTVPADAPSTLFYDCSIHPAMTGLLTITSPPVPASDVGTRSFLWVMLGVVGLAVLGRALTDRRT